MALDILLPTCNRLPSFIMTLSGVATQSFSDVRVIVSDQSDAPVRPVSVVQTLGRVIEARGGSIAWHCRVPSKGIAEQRQFLLEQSSASAVLYLDDDVLMEPWVLRRLVDVLEAERCGFVGAFPAGLSYAGDVRPGQQAIEYCDAGVRPEAARCRRVRLLVAAAAIPLGRGGARAEPDAALGRLRDRALRHLYYAELPSTVLNDAGTVDGHALGLPDEMVARYAPIEDGEPSVKRER